MHAILQDYTQQRLKDKKEVDAAHIDVGSTILKSEFFYGAGAFDRHERIICFAFIKKAFAKRAMGLS